MPAPSSYMGGNDQWLIRSRKNGTRGTDCGDVGDGCRSPNETGVGGEKRNLGHCSMIRLTRSVECRISFA